MSGDLFAFLAHPLLEFVGATRHRSRRRCLKRQPLRDGHVPASGRRHFAQHSQIESSAAKVLADRLLAQILGAQGSGYAEPG